jgi:hypothetical protein
VRAREQVVLAIVLVIGIVAVMIWGIDRIRRGGHRL